MQYFFQSEMCSVCKFVRMFLFGPYLVKHCVFVAGIMFFPVFKGIAQDEHFVYRSQLMGSPVYLSWPAGEVVSDSALALETMEYLWELEQEISSWQPQSETSCVNRNAGRQKTEVGDRLLGLVRRSIAISRVTGGAFDVTFSGLDKLYRFDGGEHPLPDSARVALRLSRCDYRKIVVDTTDATILLPDSDMKIGFGAIGKGMAADLAHDFLQSRGVEKGMVNAGGDLLCWQPERDTSFRTVALANPWQPNEMMGYVGVRNEAVVTSGDYERYFTWQGQRYAHILDPRTGYPVTRMRSVTVIAASAEMADALATAFFVMGPECIALATALPGVECLAIDEEGDRYATPGFRIAERNP